MKRRKIYVFVICKYDLPEKFGEYAWNRQIFTRHAGTLETFYYIPSVSEQDMQYIPGVL